ncbi:MAG TPA: acyltransferase [Pyrinomonadaceae bacterium]|jgi:peptidoglycan/LPS O-acetylase OafA/YrhL
MNAAASASTPHAGVAAAPAPGFRLGYRPALDGVRGVSILAVMYFHGGGSWIGRGGFLGVDIFFTLSGFLITTLLVEEWEQAGTISLANFYARRALRLLPALLAVIAACLAAVALFPPAEGAAAAGREILVALYLSDWLKVYPPLFHTWSLSIEEQFYMAWPLLLFGMLWLRLSRPVMIALVAAGVAAIALHRAALWHGLAGTERYAVYTRLDARADSLLVGCIAGLLLSSGLSIKALPPRPLRVLAVVSAACVALLMLLIPSDWPALYYGGFTAVAAMVGLVILHLFTAPIRLFSALFELSPLRWFGRISYGLYLWHLPVYTLYNNYAPPPRVGSYTLGIMIPLAIKFLLSVGVGVLSFRVVERPALRLKKRFASVRSGGPTPGGAGTHLGDGGARLGQRAGG